MVVAGKRPCDFPGAPDVNIFDGPFASAKHSPLDPVS